MRYHLEIVRDIRSFEELGPAWNELAHRFATPLLSHEWFSCIAEAFYEPNSLSVILVKQDGKLKAAAPLAAHRSHGLRQLEIIGAPFLSEPSGLLYSDQGALHKLLRAIVRTSSPSRLHRLECESSELVTLRAACRGRGVVLHGSRSAAPRLTMSGSWSDFESSLSSRRRSDMRKARRHAERGGSVEIEFVSPSPEETETYLAETDDVESRSWKGKGTGPLRSKFKRFRAIHACQMAEKGVLRMGFVRVGGRAISSMTALASDDAFWVLKIEYDDAHSKVSPGVLLMHESIRYAFESGLKRYEFLGNDEPWMHMWTDEIRTFQSPYVIPYSPQGAVALAARLASVGAGKTRGLLSQARHSLAR